MEQARHWMWTKRRHALSSNHLQASINPSYDDSWEEQAFAEDAAAGSLGGCVWPPRSYSCSFCRREFRSAQALGGHMNVHRRDRARLKESPTSPHNQNLRHDNTQYHHHHHNHDNIQNRFPSFGFQYPSQLCTLVYNPNPNSDPCNLASPSSPSAVSVPPAQENLSKQMLVPPLSSSIVPENHKRSRISSHHISDLNEGENNSDILGSQCRAKGEYVKSDLSVSLNLVVCRSRPSVSDGKEDIISCKRRRTDATPLPFFLEQSPSSLEELDLELRLGDRPKVK